jgi:hypothetical protein
MIIPEASTEEMVGRRTKYILYDRDSVETCTNPSKARACPQKRKGKKSLKPIAEETESLFVGQIMAYVSLICVIIKNHNLPASPCDLNVKHGDQDPAV